MRARQTSKRTGIGRIDEIAPFDGEGHLRVVVESPRASRVKFTFDRETGTFRFGRELPTGVAFPFDFGFIPGTLAEDGDPLDALVLHDSPSYPGIVIACRVVGAVELTENDSETGMRIRNDRVIAVPAEEPKAGAEHDGAALTRRRKQELGEFFRVASLFEGKRVRIRGWAGRAVAERLVAKAATARKPRRNAVAARRRPRPPRGRSPRATGRARP
jgi:inorganic pyrophosphatase